MRLHRFYVDKQVPNEGLFVIENEDLVYQWQKVLRYSAGDELVLFSGDGRDVRCIIRTLSSDVTRLEVLSVTSASAEVSWEVALLAAVIKKDLFEWVLEKGTEVGVSHFVPVQAVRSADRGAFDSANTQTRFKKIIQEATEQSGRSALPTLHATTDIKAAVGEWRAKGFTVIALALNDTSIVAHLNAEARGASDFEGKLETLKFALLVGPEGGWSPEEEAYFAEAQIPTRSVGPTVLRAETAAVVAAALVAGYLWNSKEN